MSGHQVGHQIELGVAAGRHADIRSDAESGPSGCRRGQGEPVAPEVVVVQQAVPVSAEDAVADVPLCGGPILDRKSTV